MERSKMKWLLGIIGLVIVIVVVMAFVLLSHASSDKVTKYEWMELLCDHTGAVEYVSTTPYFEDVDNENEYFAYIQSAVEWEYISEESIFCGDEIAYGRFIALSAMKSIGGTKLQIYLKTDKEITDDEYINIALENGLIEKNDLKRGFSDEEAEKVIEKLDELYFSVFWSTNMDKIAYQGGVIELSDMDVQSYDKVNEKIIVSDAFKKEVYIGDVVVFSNKGFVSARKVSAILGDKTYLLEFPELEEVIDTLIVSDVKEVGFQDIVNYYGEENMIIAENESSGKIIAVSNTISGEAQYKGFVIEAEVNYKRQLEIYVTDNETGVKYRLPISKQLSDGYEYLHVELNIDSIFVGSQIKYTGLLGVEYADVAVDIHSDFSGEISADTEDRILLFETPIPLGSGVISVDIEIYLVTSVNGTISLQAEIPFQNAIHYEKDKGIRNIKHDISVDEPQIEVGGELTLKVRTAPTLVICEIVSVLDAELDVGICAKANITVRDTLQVCTDVLTAFPIIEVSVGYEDVLYYGERTLLAQIGITGNWEIISFDNALKKSNIHFEVSPDGTKQFVDKCTYKVNGAASVAEENALSEDDPIYVALQKGDFSYFAGTYKPCGVYDELYGGGEDISNLILQENGIVKEGGMWYYSDPYPETKPISVTKREDGSYLCQVTYSSDDAQKYFLIYPEGIIGENPYIYNDPFLTETPYIHYFSFDGGVMDIIYYKIED